eukprot:2393652-Lingulodinium_polyedra.AAC.1
MRYARTHHDRTMKRCAHGARAHFAWELFGWCLGGAWVVLGCCSGAASELFGCCFGAAWAL